MICAHVPSHHFNKQNACGSRSDLPKDHNTLALEVVNAGYPGYFSNSPRCLPLRFGGIKLSISFFNKKQTKGQKKTDSYQSAISLHVSYSWAHVDNACTAHLSCEMWHGWMALLVALTDQIKTHSDQVAEPASFSCKKTKIIGRSWIKFILNFEKIYKKVVGQFT